MMELIPAIDIIEGRCVRLKKGDFASVTIYNDDPADLVASFYKAGLSRIHCVDLDGARKRTPVNLATLTKMVASAPVKIEWGGGITSLDDVRTILSMGADRVIVGSAAATNPDLVKEWLNEFGSKKIVFGTDIKNYKIAVHGWLDTVDRNLDEFIAFWLAEGARYFLCTDISRDGLLEGPAVELYKKIKRQFPDAFLIASGGVSCYNDLMELEKAGADAAIVGKAFYEGKITLNEMQTFIHHAG
ncbi:MAG TPA: 1-(5-phosphoribosyl)-5-[(5-phosphoribosylamino)methylideneamino]imidazole-4-carboxamide isomerase [Bacteroidales bacterium]|nr:1-(5-phosphoribosyl)-5-[(5-phosphoribosylamino)methylideneamino]imidazole-4-carboxamide isomerase [Bacteroidales bacterium]